MYPFPAIGLRTQQWGKSHLSLLVGVEGGLAAPGRVDQAPVDLESVGAGRVVVEAEVSQRVDPLPAPRDLQGAGQPARLDAARDPEVELVVPVVGGERELRQEEAEAPPLSCSVPVTVEPAGERVELREVRIAEGDGAFAQVWEPKAERIVAIEVHARPASARQPHGLDEVERDDLASGPGVAADHEVAPVDPLEGPVGGVEDTGVAARPAAPAARQPPAGGLDERLEATALGGLAPDHPVPHRRVALGGRGREAGEVARAARGP